jgi:hypothetical protein
MIAKGNLHAHGVKLAEYLTASSADELAELVELRGFAATNIRDAFIDVQMQAAATRATKPFFHAYMRSPEGEDITREMWGIFANRLEKRLGFDDQPRAVSFHHKESGYTHMHIAWSRIDLETLTAIDPGLYKNKMKQLCREFEAEFGLTPVANERGEDVKTRSAGRAEFEQSRRLGTDLKSIRNTIQECWQSADSGQAFAAALAERGLALARGDRRDFVVIDREGGDHALSKRITGATAAVTRERMVDLDRAGLPSVDEAKVAQERARTSEPRQAQRVTPMSEPETPEATKTQPATEPKPETRPDPEMARFAEQRDRLIRDAARLAEADRVQAGTHSARNYREQVERDAEAAKKAENERQQKDTDRAAAGDIASAHNRYAQALGSTYSIRDPYGSLANAAMVEYSSFHRQQDQLRKDAAAEKDPDKRRLIDLRREIEGHDYMAITSERLGGISRAITMSDNDGARRDDELARTHTQLAERKRQDRTELQRELSERAKDSGAATERGGLGSAAQEGAVASQRRQPESRPRTKAEEALLKAAGEKAPPSKAREDAAARPAQQDQSKEREGLRPDQPVETAPPTKAEREISAAEKALRSAAGSQFREPRESPRDGSTQPKGRGGGRGR